MELIKTFSTMMLISVFVVSCEFADSSAISVGTGELRISFSDVSEIATRASLDIPDTSDFILTVSDPYGNIIYDGAYGASPESIMVEAGSYDVFVRSCDFTKPAFSMPQFGDEQCVVVPPGGVANVQLTCRQMNSGVRLDIDKTFLTGCPDGVLFLKSSQGKLMYSYSEKRVAYFSPGSVSLMLSSSGVDKILMTRTLQANDMLVVNVSASVSNSSSKESIKVAVDTSRTWINEDYVIGGSSSSGTGNSKILTVNQALASVGEEGVWVNGYIVGGDLTSSSASFSKPFSSKTNILLGSRSSTSSKDACLSVQLPTGSIRDELNLVDHPELLGRKVSLKGDIVEAYYGIPGIKNITDYELQ